MVGKSLLGIGQAVEIRLFAQILSPRCGDSAAKPGGPSATFSLAV
jgi:hypothetical protein